MANISVTYTFSNGTVADATAVNQNFTDIVNGTSDGTKDMSIAALTVAGTATLNGAVTLGNASGDDLTFTGLAASDFKPKTDETYYLGSSTLGWLGAYLGRNSNRLLLQNSATASASWTFTFPATAGVAGQALVNQGSGTQDWKYACADTAAKSADYTITDTDMIATVLMSTSTTNRVVTMPDVATNIYRRITVKKVDAGREASSSNGLVTITRAGSATIDGATTFVLACIYDMITLQSDGTNWHIVNCAFPSGLVTSDGSNNNLTTLQHHDGGNSGIVLPKGVWDVVATTVFNKANTTNVYEYAVGVGTASGNAGTGLNNTRGGRFAWSSASNPIAGTLSLIDNIANVQIRITADGTTTYYPKVVARFDTSTLGAANYLTCKRVG